MTTNMCETECPICMEIIDLCKNCSTTECGHQFHSNCLMKSIAFNGFGCPYCRFEMVEEIDDSEDEDDDEYQEDEEAADEAHEEGNGDGHGDDDEDENDSEDDEDDEPNPNDPLPSFELIQKKFIEKGITYDCLVKTILFNSMVYDKNENFVEYQKCNTFMEELFFDLVTKYKPEQEEEVNPEKKDFNFYFLEDEYSQRKYQREMETTLEKFLALDDDNEIDNDSNILDINSYINDNFLNNRFMEIV